MLGIAIWQTGSPVLTVGSVVILRMMRSTGAWSTVCSCPKTLTIFATVLLPLSLIAGIYGINLPLWPSSDNPDSFRLVLGSMAAIAAGPLLSFRTRRRL